MLLLAIRGKGRSCAVRESTLAEKTRDFRSAVKVGSVPASSSERLLAIAAATCWLFSFGPVTKSTATNSATSCDRRIVGSAFMVCFDLSVTQSRRSFGQCFAGGIVSALWWCCWAGGKRRLVCVRPGLRSKL